MNIKTYPPYIIHHGIKGQKWGVRRYQNYDGQYTKAGLKRYRIAMNRYEKNERNFNATKAAYKQGKASKHELKLANRERRVSKRDVKKSYKDLKRDNQADRSQKMYTQGRVTSGAKKTALLLAVGAVSLSHINDQIHNQTGYIVNPNVEFYLERALAAGAVASLVVDYNRARNVREHYKNK